jgi:hypothetical protein
VQAWLSAVQAAVPHLPLTQERLQQSVLTAQASPPWLQRVTLGLQVLLAGSQMFEQQWLSSPQVCPGAKQATIMSGARLASSPPAGASALEPPPSSLAPPPVVAAAASAGDRAVARAHRHVGAAAGVTGDPGVAGAPGVARTLAAAAAARSPAPPLPPLPPVAPPLPPALPVEAAGRARGLLLRG